LGASKSKVATKPGSSDKEVYDNITTKDWGIRMENYMDNYNQMKKYPTNTNIYQLISTIQQQ